MPEKNTFKKTKDQKVTRYYWDDELLNEDSEFQSSPMGMSNTEYAILHEPKERTRK